MIIRPMDDALIGLVALNLTESVTYDAYRGLLERYGSVRKALRAPAGDLATIPGIGWKTAAKLRSTATRPSRRSNRPATST